MGAVKNGAPVSVLPDHMLPSMAEQIADALAAKNGVRGANAFFETGSRATQIQVHVPSPTGEVMPMVSDVRAIYSVKDGHRIKLFAAPWVHLLALADYSNPRTLYIVFRDTRTGVDYFVDIGLGYEALARSGRDILINAKNRLAVNLHERVLRDLQDQIESGVPRSYPTKGLSS